MPKITKRAVDAAKPGARDVFLWDEGDGAIKGFGLRVYPSGAKVYLLQWKRNGVNRRLVLGRHGILTAEEARQAARLAAAEVYQGRDPAAERDRRRRDLNVAELCDRWIEAGCPKAKPGRDGSAVLKAGTARTVRSAIVRHILPVVGDLKLSALTSADVERLQSAVLEGKTAADLRTGPRGRARVQGGRGIAGLVVSYLSGILTWAKRHGLVERNVALEVARIPAARRDRVLSLDELVRFGQALRELEAAGENWQRIAALRLLALTGCRRSEILGLRWQEVDAAAGCLRLQDSKTGARVVPLNGPALALLAALPRLSHSWVLPAVRGDGPISDVDGLWTKVRTMAGLEGATPHTLRHTYATTLQDDGVDPLVIRQLLGHSQARTTALYTHGGVGRFRAAAEGTGQAVADALGLPRVPAKSREDGPAGPPATAGSEARDDTDA